VIADAAGFDLCIPGAQAGMASHDPVSYPEQHRHEYVRTVRDILEHRPPSGVVRVLELGAFFGVVSISLRRLGYDVTAADMPEFIEHPAQVARYERESVRSACVRLEDLVLPFADESFDVVIMCETLEHLNFNPLPLLKEINRIGAPHSLLYLSLPNATSLYNRARVLRGEAVGVDVESFFHQLEPESSEIVDEHWREYTVPEIRLMLERLGYRIETQYYFSLGETIEPSSLRNRAARLVFTRLPWLKENQTTIAIRERRTDLRFRIPATVHGSVTEL
jgi:2-polyprenyl-3-methyl-5-hydroxy-6-metoxy-1,4-benzoquinol methylase